MEWMDKQRGEVRKVQWIEAPFPHMVGAVRTKKVDACYGTEPFVTLELGRGGLRETGRPSQI
jgi:ABC-type nitrate/sulfonate/bicarbonate transport system substrate-binding protein